MNCLSNIKNVPIPLDIVMKYITLYKKIGSNKYIHQLYQSKKQTIVERNMKQNAFYLSKIILGSEIKTSRLEQLVYSDHTPKNKKEELVKNIKSIFSYVSKNPKGFELETNEFLDLYRILFNGLLPKNKIAYHQVRKKDRLVVNKRYELEQLLDKYLTLLEDNSFENSLITLHFIIDFYVCNPFGANSYLMTLIILSLLLHSNDFDVFEYNSFFKIIDENYEEFNYAFKKSLQHYDEGLHELHEFHRFIIDHTNESYDLLNEDMYMYEFDKGRNKSDNIENTIMKFDDVFTRKDIKDKHPLISDSTITRTLTRLRDKGVIRITGKGRSAGWIKVSTNEDPF